MQLKFTSRLLFLLIVIIAATLPSYGQIITPADTFRAVNILHSNRLGQVQVDSVRKLITLAGEVRLQEGPTKFDCDSASIRQPENMMEAFGNIHINDNDSIHTYSQYLRYTAADRMAYLKKNVKLTDNKGGTLYTEELEYDLKTHRGIYRNGGRVVSDKTVLTSTEGEYFADTRDIYFRKNVRLVGPENTITTDSLLYNTFTQEAIFIAPTHIVNKDGSVIDTRAGSYNLKTGKAFFTGRTAIKDSAYSVISDRSAFDKKLGIYQFEGNVKFVDSVSKVITFAKNIFHDEKKNTTLAYGKPVMIFYEKDDSTYVAADTLYSGLRTVEKDSSNKKAVTKKQQLDRPVAMNASDTSIRYFLAFHHVRIFNDSLQAVCDSLYYSTEDSTFRLFRDPVVWNDKTQIKGDTIYLFTKNRNPEHIYVFYNSLVINRANGLMYNQIGGRTLNGYFKNGNIDYIRVKGSPAESIFYPQDEDSAYVGMNRSSGDVIDIYFLNRELNKVKFVNDVNGTMYPIRQVPDDKKQLKGFIWEDKRRPKTKLELFE